MRLIDADALCEALLERWSIADTHKEKLIRAVMADIVTPIVVSQPTIEPEAICKNCANDDDGHACHDCRWAHPDCFERRTDE